MRAYTTSFVPVILTLAACSDETLSVAAAPTAATAAALGSPFPDIIALPPGFTPEGITFGRGTTFYVGSIFSGAVLRGDARTGTGTAFIPALAGREHAGLKYDARNDWLVVAGGTTGQAYIYHATTGATLAVYQLGDPAAGPTLVNDVVLARDAAYFTDSFRPVIYRLPLAPDGSLPTADAAEVIPLTGEYQHVPGALIAGNANGIVATPNARQLIVVNTTTGKLYVVDAQTGMAREIVLSGGSVIGGDGMLLVANTLYVVQGELNQIAVVRLSHGFTHGEIERVISTSAFRFPSTIAGLGGFLYVVNARFDAAAYPDVEFEVVRVSR